MGYFRKNLITIMLTDKCNLACPYCYLTKVLKKRNETKSISLDFAKKGIDDFFALNEPALRFFAEGEPTAEFDTIVKLWEYANHKSNGKLYTEIQTNGFFSPKICDWIKNHIDMTWISCDGSTEFQNFYRPTKNQKESSVVVERNIKALASSNKRLGIRTSIGFRNIDRQIELIDYFDSLGVKAIFINRIFKEIDSAEPSKETVPALDYAKRFLEAKKYASKKGIFYSSFWVVNFDEPVEYFCASHLPTPHLTPLGYVTACDIVTDITHTNLDKLIYGKYDELNNRIIYDDENISYLQNRKVSNLPKCNSCDIKTFCGGYCLAETINQYGSDLGNNQEICDAIRLLAKELGTNYTELYPYIHP